MLSVLLAIQQFGALFLLNPLIQYLNRYTNQWNEDGSLLARLKTLSWPVLSVSTICSGILISWTKFSEVQSEHWVVDLLIIFLGSFSNSWNIINIGILNMLKHRTRAAACSVMTAASSLVVSITITQWAPQSKFWYLGFIIGSALGALLAGRFLSLEIQKKKQKYATVITLSVLKSYLIPMMVVTGLMWYTSVGFRLSLGRVWGLEELGKLTVCLGLASQVWALLESIVGQWIYPHFYATIATAGKHRYGDNISCLIDFLVPIYLFSAAILNLAAPIILWFTTDSKFHSLYTTFSLALVFEAMRTLTNTFAVSAQLEMKVLWLIPCYLAGSFVIIIGMYSSLATDPDVVSSLPTILLAGATILSSVIIITFRRWNIIVQWKRWLTSAVAVFLSSVISAKADYIINGFMIGEKFLASALIAVVGIVGIQLLSTRSSSLNAIVQGAGSSK